MLLRRRGQQLGSLQQCVCRQWLGGRRVAGVHWLWQTMNGGVFWLPLGYKPLHVGNMDGP